MFLSVRKVMKQARQGFFLKGILLKLKGLIKFRSRIEQEAFI